jgi:hypothetical protein
MVDRTRLRIFAKRLLVALVLGLIVTFTCDYIYFQFRMLHPQPANPVETFKSPRLYAIAVKGGKVDYELDEQNPQQTWICSRSLFPQAGHSPCWYIKPKSRQPIPM